MTPSPDSTLQPGRDGAHESGARLDPVGTAVTPSLRSIAQPEPVVSALRARVSPWRLVARGGAAFAVLVVANALVQAVLEAVDPRLPMSVTSLLIAAGSGLALLAAVVVLWRIAERAARLPAPRSLLRLVLSTVVTGLVIGAAAILFPPVVPLVVVAGCAVLAAGGGRAAGAAVARHPLRFVALALALVTVLTVVLAWVIDLLLGLLITGAPAAAVSWLVVGVASVVVACHWLALALRPEHERR